MVDRETILDLLGPDAREARFDHIETVAREPAGRTSLNRLRIKLGSGDVTEGIFVEPVRSSAPGLLYCHAHGGRYDIGHNELIDGRPALSSPYLSDLIDAGFAVLCIDMPCFASRSAMQEDALSKSLLWFGRTLFGQMIGELRAGLSFLAAQPGVDPQRLGTLGISMGGTHAWWLNALEARVRASVSLCCFADLATLIETGAHDRHGHYMTVPGLLEALSTGALAGLAAPSAQFHGIGLEDWSSPKIAFEKARNDLELAYEQSPEQVTFHIEAETGHSETEAMRAAAMKFLKAALM